MSCFLCVIFIFVKRIETQCWLCEVYGSRKNTEIAFIYLYLLVIQWLFSEFLIIHIEIIILSDVSISSWIILDKLCFLKSPVISFSESPKISYDSFSFLSIVNLLFIPIVCVYSLSFLSIPFVGILLVKVYNNDWFYAKHPNQHSSF